MDTIKITRWARGYAILEAGIGIALGCYCTYLYVSQLIVTGSPGRELLQLFVLFLLAYLCRCFPIFIRPDFAIDMAFISNVAILLIKGPVVAAMITFVSSPFVVERHPDPSGERTYAHIFNTPLIKSAFNYGNFTLSVFLGGQAFTLAGGVVGDISLPGVIVPMLAMIFVTMLANSSLLLILFKLNNGQRFFSTLFSDILNFFPSVLAAAPIGFFIAKLMLDREGEYLALMFMVPLFLARYTFSLYIDGKQNYYVMLKTLTYTLEAKDGYTRGHSERVERYSKVLAKEMRLTHSQTEDISVAALLHDVGKIGIDERILRKPMKLTPDERYAIEKHPEISVHILKEVKLRPIVFDIILHHHERYDGNGYPSGSGGDKLPIEVYILGVADTYDAVTSTRPYSQAKTQEEAKEIILSERGMQFHPKVVDAFVRAIEKGKLVPITAQETGESAYYMI